MADEGTKSTGNTTQAQQQMSDAGKSGVLQSGALTNVYENIVGFSLGGNSNGTEVINILNNYYWTINPSQSASADGQTIGGQIPFVYVAERRQIFSSQITNIINSIMSLQNAAHKIGESVDNVTKAVGDLADNLKSLIGDAGSGLAAMASDAANGVQSLMGPDVTAKEATSSTTESSQSSADASKTTEGNKADGKTTTSADGKSKETPAAKATDSNNSKSGNKETSSTSSSKDVKGGTQANDKGTEAAKKTEQKGQEAKKTSDTTAPTKTVTAAKAASNPLIGNKKEPSSFEQKANSVISSMGSFMEKLGLNLDSIYEQSHVKSSSLLYPYLYLYATASTNKYYVFPFLTEDAAKFHVTNNFSDSAGDNNAHSSVLSNAYTDVLQSAPKAIGGWLNDVMQLTSFFAKDTSGRDFTNNWVEMGKFYNYATDGDEITVSFPLFNTVEKNSWKKNHRFCYGFALRNMPFKIDSGSYKMPLLYDVQIPGVKRLPFAYVADLTITPHGVIRPISGENYIRGITSGVGNMMSSEASAQGSVTYNIPEAWIVTIRFKDLVGASANKVLAQLAECNISASVGEGGKEE